MELILTSFGLSHRRSQKDNVDIFYRMPPASLSAATGLQFTPDYAVLLLCDRIVLDTHSYNKIVSGEYNYWYQQVVEVIKALYEEGFVRIEDFDSIVEENHELLDRMLKHDLSNIERWINPYKESFQAWQDFIHAMRIMRGIGMEQAEGFLHLFSSYPRGARAKYELLRDSLNSSTKRRKSEYKEVWIEVLTEYLAYDYMTALPHLLH